MTEAALPPVQDVIGLVLKNTYRVTAKIADGGMGSVYEAVNERLTQKRYAIKILHANLVESEEALARFRREAEVVARLGHKHIVEVLDFDQTPWGTPYIVMEYLVGQTLQQRLEAEGTIPPLEVIQLLSQVSSALQAAHDEGIVHRDVKPDNIFLVDEGDGTRMVKVLDFGVSKIRDSSSIITAESVLLGTPYYMSPEQAVSANSEIDPTTDIFALAAISYECLSGQRPFAAENLPGVIFKIVNKPHPPLYTVTDKVPPAVDAVLARALAKQKAERFQRVEEFVAALARAISSTRGPGPRPKAEVAGSQDEEKPSVRKTLPAGSGSWSDD
jgi:serine/threonine protein kinase